MMRRVLANNRIPRDLYHGMVIPLMAQWRVIVRNPGTSDCIPDLCVVLFVKFLLTPTLQPLQSPSF